jgi:hypothetical protein
VPIADPRDIAGLVAWYSAEAETGYADGDVMTGLTDLSGNGNHAVAAGTLAPQWQAATGPGGSPAVRFRGTHGSTSATWGYFTLPASIMGSAAAGEVMATLKSDFLDCSLWGLGLTAGTAAASHYPFSSNIYEAFGTTARKTVAHDSLHPQVISSWRRYNVWSAANDYGIRLDAVSQFTSAANSVLWDAAPVIGHGKRSGALSTNTGSFKGHMSAFVLYNRKLTTTERDDLDAWLAANPGGGTNVPNPPTDLAVVDASDTEVIVDWVAPTTGETGVSYEWRIDGGTISPTDVELAIVHSLTADTTYLFEVRSVGADAVSAWASLEVATTPPPGPQPPSDLTQTDATPASIEVTWVGPLSGAVPTGYDVRIDGGAPIPVGLVLSYEATALDPETDYVVEVRSTTATDASAWASVVATTTALDPVDPEALLDWTLDITVGAHSWTVNAGDPAGYGPLAGLRVGWAARQDDGWPTHPEPASCTFQVLTETADELADVDLGTPVHVVFTPTTAAAPLVEFGGIVRAATQVAHDLGQVTAINALDYTVLLAETPGPQLTTAQQTPQQRFELLENPVIIDGSLVNPPANPYPAANTDVATGWYPALEAQRFASVLALLHHTLARQVSPRMVLTQRLTDGLLDPVRPWEAVPTPATTIPITVNAGLLHTQPTSWTRDRSIPNVVGYNLSDFPAVPDQVGSDIDLELERPHPGTPDIRRNLAEGDTWPSHVIAGQDGPSRWTTVLEVAGYLAPELPAGWFTQPDAQRHELTVPNIADRHNPNAPGDYVGLLAGAELTIPPGGQWLIRATLRRVLFDD